MSVPNKPAAAKNILPPGIENRISFMKRRFSDFDLERVAPHLFMVRTGDMLWKTVGRYLAPYGLTPPAMGVLIILESDGTPMPMHSIGEESLVTPANMTGLIDTLEKSGFVRRVASASDRRIKLVEMTAKGKKIIGELLPGFFNLINSIYSDLTPDEARTLRNGLEKVLAKLITLGAALLLFAVGAVGAGAAEPAVSTLTFREAVAATLKAHPSLQAQRSGVDRAVSEQLRLLGAYDTSLGMSIKHLDSKTPPAVFFQTARTVSDSVETSVARRFPLGTTATAAAGYSKEEDDTSSAFSLNPRHRSRVDLAVKQPLLKGLIGFPERTALRASDAAVRAARADLAHASEGLARRVAGAYWDLWEARQSVGVHQASQDESKEFLATTQKLHKRFEAEKDDLLRAEADLLSKELELLATVEAVRQSGETLAALMMINAEAISERPLDAPPAPAGLPNKREALARALAGRQDLAASGFRSEGARLNLAATAGLGLPNLDLQGSLGWSGLQTEAGDSLSQLGRAGYRSWGIGLSFSYAFGARADKGGRLAAESSALLADEITRGLRREIEKEISITIANLNLATQKVRISRLLEEKQDEVLLISRTKYGQGRISSRDRLQAANAALGARRARIGAAAGFVKTLCEEKSAEGRLLEWVGNGR